MENQKIKFVTLFIIIFFSALLLESCGDDTVQPPASNNSDSCGNDGLVVRSWSGPLFNGYVPATYTLGSERYYNFFFEVDSICTDNHVSSLFEAVAKDVPGRPIRFDAAIEWQIFWEKRDTGITTIAGGNRSWNAEIRDLGLRVPFNDNPATVYVNIYVHFLSLGSAQQDSAFLAQNLTALGMDLKFKYHKFPADDNLITSANYYEMKLFYENDERYLLEKKMKSTLNHDFKKEKVIR